MSGIFISAEPIYLASNYTRHPRGWTAAYLEICKISARIHRKHKLILFSPIAHCHGMATHGDLPIIDAAFWKKYNAPFIEVCGGCIVAKMDGWQDSEGVRGEIADFKAAGKPIYACDTHTLELEPM